MLEKKGDAEEKCRMSTAEARDRLTAYLLQKAWSAALDMLKQAETSKPNSKRDLKRALKSSRST